MTKEIQNTLILDGLFVYQDFERCFDGKNPLEIIYQKSQQNGFQRFILLQNGKISNVPEGIKNIIIKEKPYPAVVLEKIQKEAKNADNIMIINAGCPFYDPDFIAEMLTRHENYLADYTYSIGYPEGLVPVIIRREVLKELNELVKDDETIKKDYHYHALFKDINSFDIETFLAPDDLRIYRLSIGWNDPGELLFTRNLYSCLSGQVTINRILEEIKNHPEDFYTVIYSLILELTNYSPVKNLYHPELNEPPSVMDIELIMKISDAVKNYHPGLPIILGGVGEPAAHPQFETILLHLLNNEFKIIIETGDVNIDKILIKKFDNYKERLSIVFRFDAYDQTTFNLIHPGGDFNNAVTVIKNLQAADFTVYKEITRMNENEVEIEKYVRNKEADHLIIRKYSTYCGLIPDKKTVDLSPLSRIPCFHVRRSMYVTAGGKVPVCMYSRQVSCLADWGNEDLETIQKKLKEFYSANARQQYTDFCRNCDDYYVFNF